MGNDFYDNSDEGQRFQPGTTVRGAEVDAKFDGVASGFDLVDIETRRALKLPAEAGASQELIATPLQRRRKVVGFDENGNVTLMGGFGYRRDWATATEYFVNDVFRDPASKNLYVTLIKHTSTTIAADLADGKIDLAVSVAEIEQFANEAQGAAETATTKAEETVLIAENVASVTNFKGSWSDATGAAEVPSSYFHNYRYWNLLQPLADISAVEPGADAAVWAPVDVSVANVGDLVYSAKDLTSEGYLPMETAGTYLQASFPSLFGLIGLGTDRFSGAGPTLPLPPLENSVRAIVPSNTGAFMLFGSPYGIDVVETSGWTIIHSISGSFNFNTSVPNQATWSYNDEFLRVQGDGDSVYRTSDWADMANSGAFLANFQQVGHMGFAFSPTERKAIGMDSTDYDKKRLVTFDNSLSVLSETIMTGVPDGFSRGPVFSNDGTKVLIVRNNSYDICEPVAAPTGVITKAGNLGSHGNSWSPDGNYIATSSSIYPLLDGTTGDNIPITGDLGTTLQYTCWEKSSKTVFYAERSSGEPMVIAVDVDSATVATDVNIQNGAAESVALTDNEQFLIVGRLGSLQPMSIAQYIFDPQTEFYIGATNPIPLDAPSNITLKPFIKAEG